MIACFNGCSFTVGEGFPEQQRRNYIFDYIVCREMNFQRKNIALAGSSNLLIFQRSCYEIIHGDSDIVFNQWSRENRLSLSPGPNCYLPINQSQNMSSFEYRDLSISKRRLEQLKNDIGILNHDFQNIIDLCLYVQILNDLAVKYNKKLFHINGLLQWNEDLIKDIDCNNLANSLSTYTKEILDFNYRDDSEIIMLVEQLQSHVKQVDKSKWINLFDSFQHNVVDAGPQGHHPGIQSHAMMAEKTINFLRKQL